MKVALNLNKFFNSSTNDLINSVFSNDFWEYNQSPNIKYWYTTPDPPMDYPLNYLHYDFSTGLDVKNEKNQFTITAEVPGARPEDVEIDIDRKNLHIRARKSIGNQRFFEFQYNFPISVDPDESEATLEHGILTIIAKKHSKDAPRRLPVASQLTQIDEKAKKIE